jgi:hypothetical protein
MRAGLTYKITIITRNGQIWANVVLPSNASIVTTVGGGWNWPRIECNGMFRHWQCCVKLRVLLTVGYTVSNLKSRYSSINGYHIVLTEVEL